MTDTHQLPSLPTLQPGDSHMESLIEAAIQGHADTREAMRWLVRQLVPATQPAEVSDEQIAACVKRASTYGLPFVGLLNPGGAPSDFSKRFTAELLAVLALRPVQVPMTDEPVQADSSGHLRVIASLGAALRRLSFAAQTTGGTAGPDAELQSAIGQAEQALSMGGIGQTMFATPGPVGYMNAGNIHELKHGGVPYGYVYPQKEAGVSIPVYDHPAPCVPDDSKRLDYLQDRGATIDLIPGVAGFYPMRFRVGGLHSSANIDVRAAIDAAMLAASKAQKGGA